MNIVQEILAILLKATHYKLFRSSFPEGLTKREMIFIETLELSPLFEKMKIRKTKNNDFVLTWDSIISQTVAFPLTDTGFFFSDMKIYDKKTRSMGQDVSHYLCNDVHAKEMLEIEIQEMKTLFLSFSIDAPVYFK